jgi:hypothetical protein
MTLEKILEIIPETINLSHSMNDLIRLRLRIFMSVKSDTIYIISHI